MIRILESFHDSNWSAQSMNMWALLVSFAVVNQVVAFEPINTHYHRTVGIPEAARIKALEQAIDFNGARIVGGSHATLGQYPHLAGLLIQLITGQTSICGATLVSNTKLLTAAHCWADDEYAGVSMEVVLGSTTLFSGGTRITTNAVETHASYNPSALHNDIGIITIPWTAYTDTIQPATLPSGFLLYLTFEGTNAQAAGFGRTSDTSPITTSQVASHVTLQIMSNLECQSLYGFGLIESHLCTYGYQGRATCGGDSGGPLTVTIGGEPTLVGVVSFNAASGCESLYPSGFTRVTSFINWINARL